jgi:uncharacterized protein (TIGR02147 family)
MEQSQDFRCNMTARWLEAEYMRRKKANTRYSLRSFAKSLDIPPGRLSELLSRKRHATPALVEKLANRLGLSPKEKSALIPKAPKHSEQGYSMLDDDNFALIAEGAHIAFLCLMETSDFRSNLPWIAKRLGISSVEARAVALRLERLNLIGKKLGKWIRLEGSLQTPTDIPSAALRRSHKETIAQALSSIDAVPLDQRDITSMAMAIDPAKLPLAKAMIREFRYRLAEVLESGNRSEVYHLNLQLFPVTQKETHS